MNEMTKKVSCKDNIVTVSDANYIKLDPKPPELSNGLCCCEYINRQNERFHLLGCCCNCTDFDSAFTSLIKCRKIHKRNYEGMLLTFQDRLRIPWRGGAKQVAWDTAVPLIIILPAILIAAKSAVYAAIVFTVCSVMIAYLYRYAQKNSKRTRFFISWIIWSLINMVVLFELAVPLLELLPEENLVLTLLSLTSVGSLMYTNWNAPLNHVIQSFVAEDELPDIAEVSTAEEEEAATTSQTALLIDPSDYSDHSSVSRNQPNICSICHKYVTARTAHCSLCNACIMRYDHHSYWLNCCIGESNHRYYFLGLVLGELALLMAINLISTAVCHPFLVARVFGIPLMLPDDCSEVFNDYSLGLSFIIAIYALLIAILVFIEIIKQMFYISLGITTHERINGQRGNRRSCLANWKVFLFGSH